ncbi:transcriptional activator ligand binding domain protein [Catenulispora acidiphila DSM 44928]|uniref:Transcriptional activator ligand binding domain protein n=1 Tax=Catenulispora acidiphila (strain DSM 44928 / JCM 14897 / NBRC 102108 / NRRL B-24433 / ID139908) TaxID=479433 RepID=C7PZY0_CATAD|nr:GyrI-like domain-containing protein [Catenulispora acidiphila]ACU75473.1 transcriptional activator ligand binding domain protein [Catenulispora acidiphila DSM 44928]
MPIEPVILHRTEQPYIGITQTITMQTFDQATAHIPQLFAWLDARGLAPDGPPFLKLNIIDMERELQVEAGVPIADGTTPDDTVHCGTLPAGRYLALTTVGSPDEHIAGIAALFDWADAQGLVLERSETDAGSKWAGRLEELLTDPSLEPDPNKQEIQNLFLLVD